MQSSAVTNGNLAEDTAALALETQYQQPQYYPFHLKYWQKSSCDGRTRRRRSLAQLQVTPIRENMPELARNCLVHTIPVEPCGYLPFKKAVFSTDGVVGWMAATVKSRPLDNSHPDNRERARVLTRFRTDGNAESSSFPFVALEKCLPVCPTRVG
jgi:hypothetical protein